MTIELEVWVRPALALAHAPGERCCVTEATFTFVAIDDERKPRRVPRPDTE
ncbi:MAG: hypothetical protein RIK87_10400 [Fuerstiella sp.]